jgi:hypothetical protein
LSTATTFNFGAVFQDALNREPLFAGAVFQEAVFNEALWFPSERAPAEIDRHSTSATTTRTARVRR